MDGIYLTVVKHKDHFIFAFAIIFSTFILLNNENPKMSIVRGKATDIVSFFSSFIILCFVLLHRDGLS